jgi:hypothetical protein
MSVLLNFHSAVKKGAAMGVVLAGSKFRSENNCTLAVAYKEKRQPMAAAVHVTVRPDA